VTNGELCDLARLAVDAEIAKIHTIEWTPQLLYDEPLYIGRNAHWSGLLSSSAPELTKILHAIAGDFRKSEGPRLANRAYSVFESGPGIVGSECDDAFQPSAQRSCPQQ